mmetsp:Transcript_49331/g.124040  ORF Transcript_49331/g.124040 Transcript_49331/m.124040 type:complete len:112 (-) Transcript_49331:645-980(-)
MEYQVEAIVDHRGSPRNKSQLKFRVRWKGYEPDEDTWEPYASVKDCEALDVYAAEHPELRLRGESVLRTVGHPMFPIEIVYRLKTDSIEFSPVEGSLITEDLVEINPSKIV